MDKEKGVVEDRMLENKKEATERTAGEGGREGEGKQAWNSRQKTRMKGWKKGVEQ